MAVYFYGVILVPFGFIYIYTSYMLAVIHRQAVFSDIGAMRSFILIQSNFGFSVAFIIENCNYISILVY